MPILDTTGPEHTYVQPGEQAILACQTSAKPKFCSFFHFASKQSYTLSEEITGYEDRNIEFEDLKDPEKKTCGMRITKVKEKHNGEWRCDITTIVDGHTKKGLGTANITVIR